MIENAGNSVVVRPSLTVMTMPAKVPVSAQAGVPWSVPSDTSNVAQSGLFWIAKLNGSPSASWAAGRNEYGCPCVATVAGEPEICGALLDVPGFGGGPLSAGLELGPDDPPPHAASNETVTSRLIRHPAGALMALTSLTNTPRHLELPPLDTPQFMAARLNRDRPVS